MAAPDTVPLEGRRVMWSEANWRTIMHRNVVTLIPRDIVVTAFCEPKWRNHIPSGLVPVPLTDGHIVRLYQLEVKSNIKEPKEKPKERVRDSEEMLEW